MALRPETERVMSKTTAHNSEASLEVHELKDEELDAVTGGVTIKQKVVDDAQGERRLVGPTV